MVDIEANLRDLEQRIAEAAGRAGRDPAEITLVAVTKMFTVAHIQAACELGVRHFGENRVGEAAEKVPIVNQWIEKQALLPITWHLVGHLQSRKARDAIQLFDIVHSVDTLKLARRLDRLLPSSPPGPALSKVEGWGGTEGGHRGIRIAEVSLSGDFFFYPADKLEALEDVLAGVKLAAVEPTIAEFYRREGIESPGVTPADFARALTGQEVP